MFKVYQGQLNDNASDVSMKFLRSLYIGYHRDDEMGKPVYDAARRIIAGVIRFARAGERSIR